MRALTLLLPLALAQRNSSGLELRIAKGLGSKGYEKVRVSVIAGQEEAAAMDFPFAYREAFKYRWTKNYLLSSLMTSPEKLMWSWVFVNPIINANNSERLPLCAIPRKRSHKHPAQSWQQESRVQISFFYSYIKIRSVHKASKSAEVPQKNRLKPGANVLQIQGQQVVVDLPPEDGFRFFCQSSAWFCKETKRMDMKKPRSIAMKSKVLVPADVFLLFLQMLQIL